MSRHEIHTLRFDDLAEAARFARDTSRVPKSARDSEGNNGDRDWDLGANLSTALRMAEGSEFWDGVTGMMDAMEVTDKLAAKSELPRVLRHIVGSSVSVPRYLVGDPRCMRRRSKSPAVDKPVLTIGIALGLAWHITAEQRLNFGAALLSAVDQLERSGYRVEIIAFWRAAANNNVDPYKHWVNIEYMLKQPDRPLNPSAIAYAIAHPAFQRRVTWRIAETQPQYKRAIDGCYADNTVSPLYDRSCAEDFDVYFGNAGREMSRHITTPEKAFKYVETIVADQLARAQEAAA